MKKLLVTLLALSSLTAFAQSVGPQDVEPMLQQMQASGQIDAKQAEITRKYMQQMKAEDWKNVENKAKDCIARNPAAAEQLKEDGAEGINMDMCK